MQRPSAHAQPFSLLTGLYGDAEMAEIFSIDTMIRSWLETEAALALAQGREGRITQDDAETIAAACAAIEIDTSRLIDESRSVGYPILPLVRQLAEQLPEGANGRAHYGATTQDIMDTGLALQLRAAISLFEGRLAAFGDALSSLASAHATTLQAARTHGQQAVPTTFGAKLAVFLDQASSRLETARGLVQQVGVVSLFGAGGTSAAFGTNIADTRRDVAHRLGLANTESPWHVNRDRIVAFGQFCADCSTLAIRLAREIIDLSRTEIGEVREPGGHHAGASSTMPQKINPVLAESTLGLGAAAVALAPALHRAAEAGHERSAGEWQIEWHILPQIATLASSALVTMTTLLEGLQVLDQRMSDNLLADNSLLMAEAYMIVIAERIGRERAHDLVYDASTEARKSGRTLAEVLATNPALSGGELEQIKASDYVGEAGRVVEMSVLRWQELRREVQLAADPRASRGWPS